MVAGKVTIHAVDYVIFAAMLLGTLAIGVYHAFAGGGQRTTSKYLTGDRNLNFIPVSVSLTASFFSSILMLGFPAEAYTNGGMYWLYAVGIAIGAILSATLFVPVFHPLKLTSVNEYLARRYNSRFVAILGSLSNVTGMALYTSIVYFAPATAVKVATGFPTWASIVIGSAITIIYTSIGGIKAVIWTDVFQAVLMLIGLLTISIHAVNQVGGIEKVWEIAEAGGRLNIIDFNPDPTQRFTFWSLTIGVGFFDMNRYGTQQAAVQRYCSLSSVKKAIICVLCLIPFTAVMTFIASLTGIVIYSYYAREGCDPLAGKFIENPNQLVPHFVQVTLNYPGVQGILLASLVSASLSTASSALNSSAANLWKDIIHPIWPNLSNSRSVIITKVLVVAFGVVSTSLAFALIGIGGTVVQMVVTFFSACGGPTTAMFLLGILFSFTNGIGAATGGIVGFIFAMWMGFGSYSINRQHDYLDTTTDYCDAYAIRIYGNLTTMTTAIPTTTVSSVFTTTLQPDVNPLHKLYSVSYLWIGCFSTTVAFVVGLLVSLISGRMRSKTVDPELYHPWVRRFYCPDYNKDKDIIKPSENGIEKSYYNDNFLSSENGPVNNLKQKENGDGEKPYNNMDDIFVTQL